MNEKLKFFVEDFFLNSNLNRLPESYGGGRIFSTPLIGIALGNDPIFQKFKEVVSPEHLTPVELWLAGKLPNKEDLSLTLRVISIACPYSNRIREEGKKAKELPADIYSLGIKQLGE